MSEFQHALVGGTILMVLWMVFFKDLLKSPRDEEAWEEWKDIFRKFW